MTSKGTPILEQDATIVVIGVFEPSEITGRWLVSKELFSEEELKEADVQLTTRERSLFSFKRLSLEVFKDRLLIGTRDLTEFERLRDFGISFLSASLDSSILRPAGIGLNRARQMIAKDENVWHKFGDRFVPKTFWNEYLVLPGLRVLTVQGAREGIYEGTTNVTVQPWLQVVKDEDETTTYPGVVVQYNDHYELEKRDEPLKIDNASRALLGVHEPSPPSKANVSTAIEILRQRWEASMENAGKILEAIETELAGTR